MVWLELPRALRIGMKSLSAGCEVFRGAGWVKGEGLNSFLREAERSRWGLMTPWLVFGLLVLIDCGVGDTLGGLNRATGEEYDTGGSCQPLKSLPTNEPTEVGVGGALRSHSGKR